MLRPPLSSSLSSTGPSRLSIASNTDSQTQWNAPRSEIPPVPTTTLPKKSSRNDIFSLDWSAPVSPHVASRASTPTSSAPASVTNSPLLRPISNVSGKGSSFLPSSPLTAPIVRQQPPGGRPDEHDKGLQISVQHHDQPEGPSMNELDPTEQDRRRHQGADRIGSTAGISDNPVLDSRQSPRVRLVPNSEYLLGEGRHASVYLSSFVPRHSHGTDSWKLCAAKRILPDRESQLAGLGEAFILSKLNAPPQPASPRSFASRGSRFIIGLFGVRDERDGVESMGVEGETARRKKAWNEASSAASLGLGRPLGSTSHSDLRAASEMMVASSLPQRRSLRRKQSFEPSNLSPPIGSPSVEHFGADYFPMPQQTARVEQLQRSKGPRHSAPEGLHPPTATETNNASRSGSRLPSGTSTVSDSTARALKPDSPRIILLIEYAPYGHALTLAKTYPERMGKKRWLSWAREILAAVAWAHERGVLHSDIKPQNVLIASDLSIRLADFGMSMFLPSPGSSLPLPSDPIGLGTPAYSPPEFVRPSPSPFGRPSDIFSLGVTLSVLISGHEPYENMRSVERMLWVGRGGYWDWEIRRREGGLEESASASVSRAGSIRSGRTRSRAGSGASSFSALGGVAASLALPVSISGRRSASVESERSSRSVASGRAGPRTLARCAERLLQSDPATESGQMAYSERELVPPPSPPLGSDDEHERAPHRRDGSLENTNSQEDEREEQLENGGGIPFPTMGETYSDGTPVVYFLDGMNIVPIEVLNLLQAMTHPKPSSRPTAEEALKVLDGVC